MIGSVQNPNSPTYWQEIKDATALRNANALFLTESAKVRVGMIYEAYVAELAVLVSTVARRFNLSPKSGAFQEFRKECARLMHLPELAESKQVELIAEGVQATREATENLYSV